MNYEKLDCNQNEDHPSITLMHISYNACLESSIVGFSFVRREN